MTLSRLIFTPLFSLAFCVTAFATDDPVRTSETETVNEADYASEDFDTCSLSTPQETWAYWDAVLSDEDKNLVKATPFDDLITFHMGWGMGIRNGMCLWRIGPLKTWFETRGVSHPDSMSHKLIQLYWAYLNDCKIDPDAFVRNEEFDSDEHLGCD